MAQQNLFYLTTEKIFNTLSGNGYTVSYGDEEDIDIQNRQTDYPIAHVIYNAGSTEINSNDLSFTIIVADKVDQTDNKIIKYAKDNTLDIQQDMMVRMGKFFVQMTERYKSEYDDVSTGYDISYPVNHTAFREDYPNILSGFVYNITFSIPNMADLC